MSSMFDSFSAVSHFTSENLRMDARRFVRYKRGKKLARREEDEGWDRAIGHEKRQRLRYIWLGGKSRLYRNALIRLASRISRVSFFVCFFLAWFFSVLHVRRWWRQASSLLFAHPLILFQQLSYQIRFEFL